MMFSREHVSSLGSTQDYAKTKLNDLSAERWLLFTADEQTDARGTRNKRWFAPPLVNIYATYLIPFPKNRMSLLLNLPQVVAYATAQVLEQYDFKPKLKWINDVMLNHQKVGGILCEAEALPQLKEYMAVAIGIGINVNMSKHCCAQVDQPTTSLLVEADRWFDKELILAQLSEQLVKNINQLIQQGFADFLRPIMDLQAYMGEWIVVDCANEIKEGLMLGLNSQGRLRLKTKQGIEELLRGSIIKK